MGINESIIAVSHHLRSVLLFFVSCILLNACHPTKYVPQNEYLLRAYEVELDNKNVKKEQVTPYIRQKPNKKIIGMRFHLWLYNKSKLEKDNGWNRWLRKNGEEPVIWQQNLTDLSKEQLVLRLRNQGYYYAQVSDTVILKKKNADVHYRIKTGWPYVVSKLSYVIPDTAIARLILQDTVNTLIKPGMLFDAGILGNERKRVENNLKENGYYSFSEEFITYPADTAHKNRTVSLEMNVRPHREQTEDNQLIETPYPQFTVRSLTVNASLSMQNLMDESANVVVDTLHVGKIQFLMPPLFPVKASTIAQSMFIYPGSLYKISRVNRTYQYLQSLRNFRQVSIEFTEPPGQNSSLMRELDCRINLLPFLRQGYKVEMEGTNSDGNLGGGISLLYQNRSLFGRAEIFDMHLRGMIEAVSTTQSAFQFKTTMEYEAEATLNIPKFLLPVQLPWFVRRYNPKTAFSILYNYQRRPQYTRSVFSTSMGYNWRGSNIISHTIRPVDVNYVQLDNVNDQYNEYLEWYPYLKNSYQTHMVVSSNYTFIRDLRQIKKDDFLFIRTNFETAGLLLNTIFKMTDRSNNQTDKPYEILNNPYSQFVKGDVDLRYYYTINGNNRLVGRFFTGVGWPYGNSKTMTEDGHKLASMPFEKKYFSGGANSLRGWRLRSLGPGSFKDSISIASYPNNTGDIKLEANLEYRFKLVWVIEGAFFVDAGNVWDAHKDDKRVGADFDFKRFYREIAVDAGIGFRFDFTYFVLSIDTGMKLHDPAGYRGWVFNSIPERGRIRDFNLSIGIGYPF